MHCPGVCSRPCHCWNKHLEGEQRPPGPRGARLSEAYLLGGRTEDAFESAQRALDACRDFRQRGQEGRARRLLGEIAARLEPPEMVLAETHYRQALALAEELGMRPLQAHCHRGLGTLYAAMTSASKPAPP